MAQRRQVLQGRDAGRHPGRLRHWLDDSGLMDARSKTGSGGRLSPPLPVKPLSEGGKSPLLTELSTMSWQSYHRTGLTVTLLQ